MFDRKQLFISLALLVFVEIITAVVVNATR
jgi:hypothetical protein